MNAPVWSNAVWYENEPVTEMVYSARACGPRRRAVR